MEQNFDSKQNNFEFLAFKEGQQLHIPLPRRFLCFYSPLLVTPFRYTSTLITNTKKGGGIEDWEGTPVNLNTKKICCYDEIQFPSASVDF